MFKISVFYGSFFIEGAGNCKIKSNKENANTSNIIALKTLRELSQNSFILSFQW
jgi:hypothetical protein